MHNDLTLFCRVCGLKQLYPQYGQAGDSPTYEICDCCGVEFGYEDMTVHSVKEYRKKWLETGSVWFCIDQKPVNWSWEKQKKFIPLAFR